MRGSYEGTIAAPAQSSGSEELADGIAFPGAGHWEEFTSLLFAAFIFLMNLAAMQIWPGGWTIRIKGRFLVRGFLLLVVLGALGEMLGGCKLFMPPEIRQIEGNLSVQAQTLQQKHHLDSGEYDVDGRRMHYVEAGTNGSVPLILFVHGSPGSWKAWAQYLNDPDLLARTRMIAVDRPGFGGSEAGQAEPSLEQQCQDIAPLLEQAPPGQRVLLVGHSFGGPVVCRLAMDHPDKVTDLIVLAGSIDPRAGADQMVSTRGRVVDF